MGRLKQAWFDRLERLAALCRDLPPTELQCLTRCSSLCCPRVGMRDMDPARIASPVVVLLPFEREYLMARTAVAEDAFRLWPVEMVPGLVIEVGMFDLGKPCPYLRADFRCGIYHQRPVDCQTFPLLPIVDASGHLTWGYGRECPSLSLLSTTFERRVRGMWEELFQVLPKAWWELYHAADDWTGWPLPEEDEVGG